MATDLVNEFNNGLITGFALGGFSGAIKEIGNDFNIIQGFDSFTLFDFPPDIYVFPEYEEIAIPNNLVISLKEAPPALIPTAFEEIIIPDMVFGFDNFTLYDYPPKFLVLQEFEEIIIMQDLVLGFDDFDEVNFD